MPGFGASDLLVRERSRHGAAAMVALAVPAAAAVLCETTGNEHLEDLVALLVAAEAIAFLLMPAVMPEGIGLVTGERRGPVRATPEGLWFRGRQRLRRAQIRNVAVEGMPGGRQVVHVSTGAGARGKGDLHVEVESEERARALVDALALDPDHHVAKLSVEEDPLRSRARWIAARMAVYGGGLAIFAGVLAMAQRHELALLALVPALLVYALLLPRARVRADVEIGADGMTLRHRGVARSVPLSSVVEVRSARHRSAVVLASGESIELRFGREDDDGAAVQHAAFVARMRRSLARLRYPRDPHEALLSRGERDLDGWVRLLLSLGCEGEGYRVATLPADALWQIIEGTVAEPTARVGALVAIHSRLDETDRARLRALAARTAQRDLRAALAAAADGAGAMAIIVAYERSPGG